MRYVVWVKQQIKGSEFLNTASVNSRYLFYMTLFLFMISASYVSAETARIKNMAVSNTRDNLVLYFELENAFTDKIIEAVESGVKISFSLPVRVYKKRRLWPDKKIAGFSLSHAIKYDAMKKEYQITRSWKPDKSLTVKSFDEAVAAMNIVDGVNLASLNRLEKGQFYSARAKAKLDKLFLPYYLKYFLFFMSFWEFETDWCLIGFQY